MIVIYIFTVVLGLATVGSAFEQKIAASKTWALATLTLATLALGYIAARWPV